MYEAFNMGMGFALFARPDDVDEIFPLLGDHEPWVAGEVIEGDGPIRLDGVDR